MNLNITKHLRAHHEDDTWWAECDDLPGWTAAAETWDDLLGLVAEAMKLLAPGEAWDLWSGMETEAGHG